jgi:4-carboxymuconolactone decarboxylase
MRLDAPRIPPLHESEWTDEQRAVLEPYAKQGRLYNIFSTLGRNPAALRAFVAWGGYVLRQSDLSPRQRELVILRIGHLCRAGYEWAQHARLGKQAGLTNEELSRIRLGPGAPDWTDQERTLLVAADELHRDYFISDATWLELRSFLSDSQCMDLVYVIGHYTQVCMILNSFGVQLDADLVEGS